MHATAKERTLLEDWQARRDRLAEGSLAVEQCAEAQLRVLDFLIRQYGDSAEAARPARGMPALELHVNNRAIVVLHHLWEKQVAGVKTTEEARMRMASVLARMACCDPDEHDRSVMRSAAAPLTPAWEPAAAPTERQQTAAKCRAALTDDDADTRMLGIDVLGRIGTLEDIGILSDLLALPTTEDEHPDERAALTEAMERIAKADRTS